MARRRLDVVRISQSSKRLEIAHNNSQRNPHLVTTSLPQDLCEQPFTSVSRQAEDRTLPARSLPALVSHPHPTLTPNDPNYALPMLVTLSAAIDTFRSQ
jgi:hypothetical protein